MSYSRADIETRISSINTLGECDKRDDAQRDLASLIGDAGLQLVPLTPYASSDAGVLRYSAQVGSSANTFFGIACPEPVDVILYNASEEAWTTKLIGVVGVAHASPSTSLYLPIDSTSKVKPSEAVYVELWKNGARLLTPKTEFSLLIGQAS
jgi:hypothetical protein